MQQYAQVEELMMPLTSVGYITLKTTMVFQTRTLNDSWLTSHFKIDFILSLSREVASLSFLAPFPSGGGGHLVQMLHTILERYIARACNMMPF